MEVSTSVVCDLVVQVYMCIIINAKVFCFFLYPCCRQSTYTYVYIIFIQHISLSTSWASASISKVSPSHRQFFNMSKITNVYDYSIKTFSLHVFAINYSGTPDAM